MAVWEEGMLLYPGFNFPSISRVTSFLVSGWISHSNHSPWPAPTCLGLRISWVYCPAQQTLPARPPRPSARLEAEIAPKTSTGKRNSNPLEAFV